MSNNSNRIKNIVNVNRKRIIGKIKTRKTMELLKNMRILNSIPTGHNPPHEKHLHIMIHGIINVLFCRTTLCSMRNTFKKYYRTITAPV